MKFQLRDYQSMAKRQVRNAFTRHRRVAMVSPTGSGKTVIGASIVESTVAKGNSVLFVAPRKEIVDQTSAKLDSIGLDHGIIMAKHKRDRPDLPVQVASIQTLMRREKPDVKLVVVDETHTHLDAQIELAKLYPNAFFLGLTATPWRTDGRGLGKMYDNMVVVAQVRDLVKRGFLVDPMINTYRTPSLDRLRVVAGDYAAKELGPVMNKPRLVGNIVRHWWHKARDLKTVVFASSVEHSQNIVAGYRHIGIRAEHVDSSTHKDDRAAILQRLKSGETQLVSNVGILTEGWDLPELECIVMARPTKSLTRYLQMVGRVMRPSDHKKRAIMLDHAGCVKEHGLPTRYRDFSLEDKKPTAKKPVYKKPARRSSYRSHKSANLWRKLWRLAS